MGLGVCVWWRAAEVRPVTPSRCFLGMVPPREVLGGHWHKLSK